MYLVLEIQQATPESTPACLNYSAETKNQAISTYHSILASAAIGSNYIHTAIVMTLDGKYLMRESYNHPVAPAQNTEEAE